MNETISSSVENSVNFKDQLSVSSSHSGILPRPSREFRHMHSISGSCSSLWHVLCGWIPCPTGSWLPCPVFMRCDWLTRNSGISRSVVSDSFQPHGLYPILCPWDSPGKNRRVGNHSLLQGNLPDPGVEAASLMSPVLANRFFTTSTAREDSGVSYWLPVWRS